MKKDTIHNESRWQDRLPSTYETLINGFHAGMTVAEMNAYLGLKAKPPEEIADIKIGAFTPQTFKHFADYWKTPIDPASLSQEVLNAIQDEDIALVQAGTNYDFDPQHLTAEMMARTAQTQYLGFQIRMGELTNQNLFNRIEKLREPEFYAKLRACPYVVKNNLQEMLPEEIPFFEVSKQEFSVKTVESALGKAYERTGNADDIETFFENPNKYGVFAVTDLQRTTLKLTRSGAPNRETMLEDYIAVRNVFAIAALSGELAIVVDQGDHCEMSDQVLYPSTDEAKNLLPVFKTNGRIYHAGPKGSHLHTRLEVQIQVMEDHAIDQTHRAYKMYRDIKESLKKDKPSIYGSREERIAMCEELTQQRIDTFNEALTPEIQTIRETFLMNKKLTNDRKLMDNDRFMLFLNKNDILGNPSHASVKRAIEVAHEEFPEREEIWQKDVIEFSPFRKVSPAHREILNTTLRDIIQMPKQAPIVPITAPIIAKRAYNG